MTSLISKVLSLLLITVLSSVRIYSDSSETIAVPNEGGEKLVSVVLPFDAISGGEWVYTAKGEGSLTEASWDEYQEQVMANYQSEDEDDGMILMPEGIPPGSIAFVFKGEQPGSVELLFVCSEPLMEVTVIIEVFSDMTLTIIQTNQQSP